jgi:hypothetical protein
MYHSSIYWNAVGLMKTVLMDHFVTDKARGKAFTEIVVKYSPCLSEKDAQKPKM